MEEANTGNNISNSLFDKAFSKSLFFGIIVLFLLTSLSPVYAGFEFSESKSIESKNAETTKVDIKNPLDRKSLLDRYDSSEIEERYHKHPYLNRHDKNYPIRRPTVIDGQDGSWDIIVPDDYDTIQNAIDHAEDGYMIYVKSGIYIENVWIDVQSLTLCGEDK